MSLVKPLSECVARPDNLDGTSNPLVDHLLVVARGLGNHQKGKEQKLRFLAGLLHDAGKARISWQRYIKGEQKEDSWHSPLGAAFFCFCSSGLIKCWQIEREERRKLQWLASNLAIDIASHHGKLKDWTDEPPWYGNVGKNTFDEVDFIGLTELVRQYFPEFHYDRVYFDDWWSNCREEWKIWKNNASRYLSRQLKRADVCYTEAAMFNVRTKTSEFITADRFDAAGIEEVFLDGESAKRALKIFSRYCISRGKEAIKNGVPPHMVETRQRIQEDVYSAWRSSCDCHFFSNVLPTGYGKTLNTLRVALESCVKGHARRIVYVAPYISILSQASEEISAATGIEVMVHHHLSILQKQEMDDIGYLAMESWQAPIVTTTYNQFFRALFPSKAQQSMRLKALENSFVIIDEPQIMDGDMWLIFLYQLRAMAAELNMRVLFTTATMPPFESGLDNIVSLAPKIVTPNRYTVNVIKEAQSEDDIAELAVEKLRQKGSVAVIMNTIKDSALIYKKIGPELRGDEHIYYLSGSMTSIHKASRIEEDRKALKNKKMVIVVCTQVLEAGVDLSFRCLLRANSVMPSIIQASGRVNRHDEGDVAEVWVFPFLRNGEQKTRQWVYRNVIAREETDRCLEKYGSWKEEKSAAIVSDYYQGLIKRNPTTGALERLVKAAKGEWSALSGVSPFGEDYPKVDVFVPFGEELMDKKTRALLSHFAPDGLQQLHDRYVDRCWMATLDFLSKKRFMSLLEYFTVPVSLKLAADLINSSEKAIPQITKSELYSDETGLALVEPGDFSLCCF